MWYCLIYSYIPHSLGVVDFCLMVCYNIDLLIFLIEELILRPDYIRLAKASLNFSNTLLHGCHRLRQIF